MCCIWKLEQNQKKKYMKYILCHYHHTNKHYFFFYRRHNSTFKKPISFYQVLISYSFLLMYFLMHEIIMCKYEPLCRSKEHRVQMLLETNRKNQIKKRII